MQVTDNPPRRIREMQRYVGGTEPRARRDRTLFLHEVRWFKRTDSHPMRERRGGGEGRSELRIHPGKTRWHGA